MNNMFQRLNDYTLALVALCVLVLTMGLAGLNKGSGNSTTGETEQDVINIGLADVGDIVIFGRYYQEFDKKTELEWIVLDKQGNELLLLSKKVINAIPYNREFMETTWEKCRLRDWLNNAFFYEAFSEQEQEIIPKKYIAPHKNPRYNTDPGYRTADRVFLLSVQEAEEYLPRQQERLSEQTPYAIENGVWVNVDNEKSPWWLRTPGRSSFCAASIDYDGSVRYDGFGVDGIDVGVRPVVWVRLRK